jgi:hypothetical protein
MIDISRLIVGLTQAFRSADFPNAETIAGFLDLNLSSARITRTERGPFGIHHALLAPDVEVGVIGALSPRRQLVLIFVDSQIPYREFAGAVFGANQRIQYSKFSQGFAVLFDVDELCGILTASGPDGVVETLSVEAPKTTG